MTRSLFRKALGGLVAGFAAILTFSGAAYAQNPNAQNFTQAGTDVNNAFVLNYEVNGSAQDAITNDSSLATGLSNTGTFNTQGTPTTFEVDRRIDLVLTRGAEFEDVRPGDAGTPPGSSTDARMTFTLRNDGNDRQDYSINLAHTTTAVTTAGSERFVTGNIEITYSITRAGGGAGPTGTINSVALAAGAPAASDVIRDLQPGDTATITITGDIPTTPTAAVVDGALDPFTIVAETRNPTDGWLVDTATPTARAVTAGETGTGPDTNDPSAVDNVFVDGQSTTPAIGDDAATDGRFGAQTTFRIADANLAAAKYVKVLSDTAGLTDEQCANTTTTATKDPLATAADADYSVPGACIEYTIQVQNTGSVTATDINLRDELPANLTLVGARFAQGAATAGGANSGAGFADDGTATPATRTIFIDGSDASASINANGVLATPVDCPDPTSSDACLVELRGALLAGGSIAAPNVGRLIIRATVD